MQVATQYIWTPPPELVAQSNLTAFLRATGRRDYDDLASQAEADPAWLMQEVFNFCDVRFYRNFDVMLDLSRGQPWARWCVGGKLPGQFRVQSGEAVHGEISLSPAGHFVEPRFSSHQWFACQDQLRLKHKQVRCLIDGQNGVDLPHRVDVGVELMLA